MTATTPAQERRAHYAALVDRDALRTQLAALAEEHEVLTHHAHITDANLALLVEKVLAYEVAAAALTAAPLEACADAEIAFHDAEFAMTDLARSLKP